MSFAFRWGSPSSWFIPLTPPPSKKHHPEVPGIGVSNFQLESSKNSSRVNIRRKVEMNEERREREREVTVHVELQPAAERVCDSSCSSLDTSCYSWWITKGDWTVLWNFDSGRQRARKNKTWAGVAGVGWVGVDRREGGREAWIGEKLGAKPLGGRKKQGKERKLLGINEGFHPTPQKNWDPLEGKPARLYIASGWKGRCEPRNKTQRTTT